jgi:hypothetical protein
LHLGKKRIRKFDILTDFFVLQAELPAALRMRLSKRGLNDDNNGDEIVCLQYYFVETALLPSLLNELVYYS